MFKYPKMFHLQTLHPTESMVSLCYRSLAGYINDDDVQGLRTFLENRQIVVDDRDENGGTALMLAATKGKLDFVRELLSRGADPNIEDSDSWTALHCAAKEGHVDICYELLQHDAKIDPREMGGWTPLMWACYKGRTQVVDLLLKSGADVNAHGNYHISALLWAAGRGHTDIVESLIKHGAKINIGDKYGTTALIWASRKGHTEIVELLLKAGANVDTAGMYSWTALLVAAQGNHVEIVHLLLECKPNVNALDKDGCSALMIACKEGYYEIATALINANAYINIQDRTGDTNLIHAVKGGHRNIVEALLKKYADVDISGKDRKTAIYIAVEKGNPNIVKLLLTANPDLEIATKDGDTPLLKAVRSRNAEIVQLLLDKKAKVSATDKKGDTALHIAMRARSKQIVEILLRNPKHSQLLYRPNRAGETPYNIDMSHQKTILGQIFGARRLNTNEDNENMLGYDLYSSALADILSEPSLSMPITVGLYAKWGSGKSFLLNKLRDEMKNFAREWIDPTFKFTSLLFLVVAHVSLVFGVVVGLSLHSWIFGLISGGGIFILCYFFIALVWFANKRYDWDWPYTFNAKLSKRLNSLRLILLVMFCHPPGAQSHDLFSVQPIRFYFTDQTRVSSTTGGENSVVQMLGSLYDAVEGDYGTFATRLYRAFRPKPVKSSTSWKWRKICCIPYIIIFEVLFLCFLAGICALTIYLVHLKSPEQNEEMDVEKMTLQIVLIFIALLLGITAIANVYTWNRMIMSLFFSQRRQLQKSIARLDTLKSEGFLQALRQEVNLMKDMVKCLDSLSAQQTRLVIIVDGLDSCEQDKVLLVLDAVHMLFSDANSPFIIILAIDPHVIAKAVELNSRRLFNESNIGGHSYLNNMVHLPFYLQNSGLRKVKTAQQTAQAHRKATATWNETEESLTLSGSNMLGRSLSNRRLSAESAIMSSNEKLKYNSRKNSRKLKISESVASSIGSNLNKIGGAQDLTKMLLTDDYFSDVNPRSMRRLMNVVYVTGRLLKAFQIDFNWYRLASWINITEQWPFRTSWIIYHYDMSEDSLDDNTSLKSLYDKARPYIPSLKETEPLLELDRDERKFDIFLSFHKSSLLVSDLKIFLPFTINLDPYLKKVIKEEMQSLEDAGIMMTPGRTIPVLPQVTPPSNMPANWGNNNQDWQNTSAVNRRRTFARPSVPVPPTVVYPNATTLVNWQQPWGDPLSMNTVRHPFPLAPITEIAPEILETKLSSLNVGGVCNLLNNIPDLSATASESYRKVIQENNISGRVLLHCDLEELKKILHMNFGDWEIFRMLIVSLREQELSSVITYREIKPRPLGITKQAASTTTRERKGSAIPLISTASNEKEIGVTQPDGNGHMKNKNSVMEKQVTLEEQMICGALQTLNEEACEDVFEETGDNMEQVINPDIPQTSVIPPSPEAIEDAIFRSRANSNAGETDFLLLQSSPIGHWQPVCVMLQNNSLSLSEQSSKCSSQSPSPVPEKRQRSNSARLSSLKGSLEKAEGLESHCKSSKHVIIKDENESIRSKEMNKKLRPNSLYLIKHENKKEIPIGRNRSKSIDIALKKIKSNETKTISLEKLNKLKAKFLPSNPDLNNGESDNESTPLMSEACSPVPSPEFTSVFSSHSSGSNSLPLSPSTGRQNETYSPDDTNQIFDHLENSPIKVSVHYTLSDSSLQEERARSSSPDHKHYYRRPRTLSECAESPTFGDNSYTYSASKSSLISNKSQSFGHLHRQNAMDSDESSSDPETRV